MIIHHAGSEIARHGLVGPGEVALIDAHYGRPARAPVRALRPRRLILSHKCHEYAPTRVCDSFQPSPPRPTPATPSPRLHYHRPRGRAVAPRSHSPRCRTCMGRSEAVWASRRPRLVGRRSAVLAIRQATGLSQSKATKGGFSLRSRRGFLLIDSPLPQGHCLLAYRYDRARQDLRAPLADRSLSITTRSPQEAAWISATEGT